MLRTAFAGIALLSACLFVAGVSAATANTYGSVEPVPSRAIAGAGGVQSESLAVREEFARMLHQCGLPGEVVEVLSSTGAIPTINELNTSVAVGAGGFAGETNPTWVFTFLDDGPNAARRDDIAILLNGLGFVMSQGSVFLLDSDDPDAFDFTANYLVVNFPALPSLEESATLFEAVGRIDPMLFATDTSGYTQVGRAYLAVQPDIDDQRFVLGYVRAAEELGLEYSPIIGFAASLFAGGAAFPGNDWTSSGSGEEYLARIPAESHAALGAIRERHLIFTERFLRSVHAGEETGDAIAHVRARLGRLQCP